MPAEYWEQGKEKSRQQLDLERLVKLRKLLNIIGMGSAIEFKDSMQAQDLKGALRSAGEFALDNLDLPIGPALGVLVGPRSKGWATRSGKFSDLATRVERAPLSDKEMRLTEALENARKAAQGGGSVHFAADSAIEHQKLFEAYPELRHKLKIGMENQPGSYGYHNPVDNRIMISPYVEEKLLQDTLSHELQHAIEQYEGGPAGSNTNAARLFKPTYYKYEGQTYDAGTQAEQLARSLRNRKKREMAERMEHEKQYGFSSNAMSAAESYTDRTLQKLQTTVIDRIPEYRQALGEKARRANAHEMIQIKTEQKRKQIEAQIAELNETKDKVFKEWGETPYTDKEGRARLEALNKQLFEDKLALMRKAHFYKMVGAKREPYGTSEFSRRTRALWDQIRDIELAGTPFADDAYRLSAGEELARVAGRTSHMTEEGFSHGNPYNPGLYPRSVIPTDEVIVDMNLSEQKRLFQDMLEEIMGQR